MHVSPALFPGRATPRQQQGKALELVPRGVHGGALSQALSPRGPYLPRRTARSICFWAIESPTNAMDFTVRPPTPPEELQVLNRDDGGALDCPVPSPSPAMDAPRPTSSPPPASRLAAPGCLAVSRAPPFRLAALRLRPLRLAVAGRLLPG